jgi:outer membrane lipoprotein-sorting protein
MKKLFLVMAGLLAATVIQSQSLEEIVRRYSDANGLDNLKNVTTIRITGKMSTMGMEMPLEMYMKNPDKIKMVYSFSGQNMVTVFDGEKGYMVNPLMGSSQPVALTTEQTRQIQDNNAFKNQLVEYLSSGKLTLEGEEGVAGKPAYKLKALVDGAGPVYMYVDKVSFYIVKSATTVNQMGNTMNVETLMSDYTNTNGVVLPKKTTTIANGMEAASVTFDKVEVNVPIEDSVFRIK